MRKLEHQEAVALMTWWTFEARRRNIDERILFAIPNGGLRNKIVASKLKAEGVRAGIPDYFLAYSRTQCWSDKTADSVEYEMEYKNCGLFIELKAKNGVLSKPQKEIGNLLENFGYKFVVCYGWQQAKEVIEDYLK